MTRLFRGPRLAIVALAGAVAIAAPALAQSPFSPAQQDAIREVVREYLVKNPEVLQEAMAELERRQAEAQKKAQAAALAESRDAIMSAKDAFVVGNPSGDVTLVEFFDYNCGYCKRALSDLRTLVKGDGKLRVMLKDLPVLGPDSVEATRIALAAKRQLTGDKLFEYHARLLETRGRVGGERALGLAREMGLDMARLERDRNGPEVKAMMDANTELAERLSLTGTPAYVIGNEIISGAVGVEPLRQAVEMTRKCGNAVC